MKKFFEEEGLAKGLASVSMDGGMVDTPVYVSACETIERYEAIQAKEASVSNNCDRATGVSLIEIGVYYKKST